jgi:hypothetical protein
MSDLLKQAIADAKAVRATALANAKAALEEAFAPKLQSMLGAKLRQEVEDDLTSDELPAEEPMPDEVPVADVPQVTDEVPVADVGPAPEGEPAPVETPVDAVPPEELPPMEAPAEEEEPEMDEFKTLGAGHPDSVDATEQLTEDGKDWSTSKKPTGNAVKPMVAGGTKDLQGAGKNVAPHPSQKKDAADTPEHRLVSGDTETVEKASPDYKKETAGHKTINVVPDKNVAPTASSEKDKDDTSKKPLEEGDVEVDDATLDEILKELEQEVSQEHCETPPAAPIGHEEEDEEINLDELFESKEEEDEDEKKEEEESKKPDFLKNLKKENISLKTELEEYRNGVQDLRNQINEVNLLNAKLLYTNRLFKQANLTNEQKLKVIESFDLTKSVREAKLVYATLTESLNFGAKKPAAPAPSTKKTGTVKQITEGLASKPVGSTKPTKPTVLTEGAEMANRFKKLAGIRTK